MLEDLIPVVFQPGTLRGSTGWGLPHRERKTGFEPATLTLAKKVMAFVPLGLAAPLKCGSVHPVSTPSIQFVSRHPGTRLPVVTEEIAR